MEENGIISCPFCGSRYLHFNQRKGKYECEDCRKVFDKPEVLESVKENTIDTRKITVFLASSITLTAERDLISSVAAESNGRGHGVYVELERCEYDNAIQIGGTQQEIYDDWIRECDVFILLVSKSGIGEWTKRELEIAAQESKRGCRLIVFAQNGAELGDSPENQRLEAAFSEFENSFTAVERYDDLADLYKITKTHIDTIRADNSLGVVIKDCLRVGYDIVITGISEKSREYVYSLADKFNIINNENFRDNEKDSLIFNLLINLDDFSNFRTNVNDYYFILAEGNAEATKRIAECYHSDNPHIFLDVNIMQGSNCESIMKTVSRAVDENYLKLFSTKEALIGKDSIRSRLEKIKAAYRDFQKGLALYREGNFFEAEPRLLRAAEYGFYEACFYLGDIYGEDKHSVFYNFDKSKKFYSIEAERGNVNALNKLGNLFLNENNETEAEKYFRMAAEKGNSDAFCNLGHLYNRYRAYSEEAKYFYYIAAEMGHTYAQYRLGHFFLRERNYPESKKYYRLAAEQGNIYAQIALGDLLQKLGDLEEAAKYWRMAAEQKENSLKYEAQYKLALYLEKIGNYKEAQKYYLEAANDPTNYESIEVVTLQKYLREKLERKDVKEEKPPVETHPMSTESPVRSVNEVLADYRREKERQGKSIDEIRSADNFLFLKAERGDAEALTKMGNDLRNAGKIKEAEGFYRIAAEQGNVYAQYNLGKILKNNGNLTEAEIYFAMAAEQGMPLAQVALEDIREKLAQGSGE